MAKKDTDEPVPCLERMKSKVNPGHIHTCIGDHRGNPNHYCRDCGQWWGKKK